MSVIFRVLFTQLIPNPMRIFTIERIINNHRYILVVNVVMNFIRDNENLEYHCHAIALGVAINYTIYKLKSFTEFNYSKSQNSS